MGYRLVIDYDAISLKERVRQGGYSYVDPGINERNFPMGQRGKFVIEVELKHFNCHISTDDVTREIHKIGWLPVNLYEILVFGAVFPDKQREFPINALGSRLFVSGNWYAISLCTDVYQRRRLCLIECNGVWGPHARFAAISRYDVLV